MGVSQSVIAVQAVITSLVYVGLWPDEQAAHLTDKLGISEISAFNGILVTYHTYPQLGTTESNTSNSSIPKPSLVLLTHYCPNWSSVSIWKFSHFILLAYLDIYITGILSLRHTEQEEYILSGSLLLSISPLYGDNRFNTSLVREQLVILVSHTM